MDNSLKNLGKPDKVVERKIGSKTYVVSSYRTNFSEAAVKKKIENLIIREAAKRK